MLIDSRDRRGEAPYDVSVPETYKFEKTMGSVIAPDRIEEIRERLSLCKRSLPTSSSVNNFIDNAMDDVEYLLEELRDYETLFELQRSRMGQAAQAWQRDTGKYTIFPDLGRLLEWLMEKGGIYFEPERDNISKI